MKAEDQTSAKPWLTVGIAAYNNEKYIVTAMQSVLKQIDERVMLIVVNDGSKDASLERIQEVVKGCDPELQQRITVIDQPNAGVSKVRNLAIERADTPYITFLDGDDYWLDDYYQSILSLAKDVDSLDVDIIEYNAQEHREDPDSGQVEHKVLNFNPIGNYRGRVEPEHLRKLFTHSKWYIWTRIYRRSLFDDLKFPENLSYEDIMLVPQLYLHAERILTIEQPLIAYRINLSGQVVNPTQKTIKDIESIIEIHLELSRQQQDDAKKKLLVLLACQSALYYKIVTNMRNGYIKSLADINRVLNKIRPLKKEYNVEIPLKTQLLFLSPLASNFYTFLKTRAR